MATEKQLSDVLEKIQTDSSGFIAASLVDLDSGMTLAVKASRTDFDLTAASAYNSELVKQKMKIMQALNIKASLEDMLLTLTDQLHLIKILPSGGGFLYVAADRGATNLAILRSAVNKHCAGLS
jgi:predicted regulator of Ras-like GTPase activity (Roadblock/LC7/MglB family)